LALAKIEEADIEFFSALENKLPGFNKNMLKLIDENKGK
jgi:hypothetical protein